MSHNSCGGTKSVIYSNQGISGPRGPQGRSAYDIAVQLGFTGTQEEWIASLQGEQGPPGKSAFDVAVENGFTGTEAEWTEVLAAASSGVIDGGEFNI